jgi:hypothetical protein
VKPFTVIDVAQRSPEWFQARCGRVTGSEADAMLAQGRSKGSESVQRKKLKYQKALERITGKTFQREFQSDAMTTGIEREPLAYAAYEAVERVLLDRAGFCAHNELQAGCSVDGYLGDFEGLVSIKCPEWHTHADSLRAKSIELGYMRQILHEQFVTGALWTDFVSYHPDFPERLQLCVVRVFRNDEAMAQHEAELRKFLAEVQVEYDALRTMAEGLAVAVA